MAKRPRQHADPDANPTPRKVRRGENAEKTDTTSPKVAVETPPERQSILRNTPTKINGTHDLELTPRSLRKVLFSTTAKVEEEREEREEQTPTALRNDRSARRKSQRALRDTLHADDESSMKDAAQDEDLAAQILDDDDVSDDDDDTEVKEGPVAGTTSKTGRPRGRPKGRRRECTPSPPPDLPLHELYFFQNRGGGNKTSSNTLPSHLLLNHEDYYTQINAYKDPHEHDIERLKQLHKRAFDQWIFELYEGFNLCLYGYGSKRQLVMDFAAHMYTVAEKESTIVVINGYTPGLTIRDILMTIASVVFSKAVKLPAQPQALLEMLLSTLSNASQTSAILLVVHSLDHANLRKPVIQSTIASLAAHHKISLLASCDTLNFPLLWDVTLTRQLHFVHHDATTFEPYRVELDAVEEVNTLLGRSGRRLGGKDGVGYVLKSLPENARNLFRILVAEQLALADVEPDAIHGAADGNIVDEDDMLGVEDDEEAAVQQETPSRRGRGRPKKKAAPARPPTHAIMNAGGVEYRTLYHKAVEEFVCSSEISFRTLLKEFHDHQMVESRKDGLGTEHLIVPFRKEELETILEDLI